MDDSGKIEYSYISLPNSTHIHWQRHRRLNLLPDHYAWFVSSLRKSMVVPWSSMNTALTWGKTSIWVTAISLVLLHAKFCGFSSPIFDG